MRPGPRPERDFDREPVALQHAAGRGDHEEPCEVRQRRVRVQRALRQVRRTAIEVRKDGALAATFEAEPEQTGLADRAARHLRRLVPEGGELRPRQAERLARGPGGEHRRAFGEAHYAGCPAGSSRSNSRSRRIRSTSAWMPSPVLQLVNRNGFSPRITRESRAITSRLAPTCGARSVLLMTRMSDCVIPGPFLRGILSPAATSMT